jgi:flagellar basal body-associated protein FliL
MECPAGKMSNALKTGQTGCDEPATEGSSAVVVVLVIFVVLIAAGVGVALFLKSKKKAPIGVAQTP